MITIPELQEIRDESEKPLEERDLDKARVLADAYVEAHPDEFTELESKTIPEIVSAIDVFRQANMEDTWWRLETWALHRFPPQQIGGEVQPAIRTAGELFDTKQ